MRPKRHKRDRVGRYLCGDALYGSDLWNPGTAFPTPCRVDIAYAAGQGGIISSLGTALGNSPAERGSLVRLAALMRRRHKESTNGGSGQGLFSLHS